MDVALVTRISARAPTRRFHVWMALVFVLVAFSGFTPSYWSKVVQGTFHAPPIVHIHGMLLFGWTLFYFVQTALVSTGRIVAHRAWGLFGIALFTAVLCSIVAAKITMLRIDDLRGFGDAARRFSAVTFCALPLLIGLFAAAIANVRRPEVHKRLMFVLMAGLMTPATARVFLFVLAPPGALEGGPPPPWVSIPPGILALVLIGVAILHDWRTGRPNKVYIYGAMLVAAELIVAVLVAGTPGWMSAAHMLEQLAG